MNAGQKILTSILIIIAGLALFTTGLGSVHLFDWDEINFAESAREMLITGDYLNVQVNFKTFWEKPPLFIWMQALSMKIFGVNEFAARFPNAIAGVLTMLTIFLIGSEWKSPRFGFLWVVLYVCSFLPFFYFKSGIIDPWFNLFIFLGIYYMMSYTAPEHRGNRMGQALLSAIFLGLATLTKGPAGFLIFLLTFGVHIIFSRFRIKGARWKDVLLFFVIFALVGGLWFIFQIFSGNRDIIRDFILYQIRLVETQDAGHGGFPLYHFVILFFGVFPASIFALPTMHPKRLRIEEDRNVAHFFQWMMITLWVVLILFSIIRTKIVHYSSMCYFPITFLAAWYIDKWQEEKVNPKGWLNFLLFMIAIPIGLVTMALPFIDQWKEWLIPYIKDNFAIQNLQATSEWYGFEWVFGLILIVGVILFAIFKKRRVNKALMALLCSSLLFIFLGSYFFPKQIEAYSQRAAIEFLKEHADEDCYIHSIYKSYAIYYYSDRQPINNNDHKEYLWKGDIDKPVYILTWNVPHDIQNLRENTKDLVHLYNKNGFAFYARYPKHQGAYPYRIN